MIQFTQESFRFLPSLAVEKCFSQNGKNQKFKKMSEIVPSDVSRDEAHTYLENNSCVFGDYVLRTSDSLGVRKF